MVMDLDDATRVLAAAERWEQWQQQWAARVAVRAPAASITHAAQMARRAEAELQAAVVAWRAAREG